LYNLLISLILTFLFVTSFIFFLKLKLNVIFFAAFALIIAISAVLFRRRRITIAAEFKADFDAVAEKINILSGDLGGKKKILESRPLTQKKVSFLFDVSQELIELIEAGEILDFLAETLKELFPQADSILLFDFDKDKDQLYLTRSLKQKGVVIKEKKGDDIDKWVARHNYSLLIEDLTKDFRFDYSRIDAHKKRGASALILSPLSVGHRLLGIVRLESEKENGFSLDDSRTLRNICDLGAVVLEKAILFERLKYLAIKDSLTSLFLRDYFFERLSAELNRAKDGRQLGMIMLDIDDFKKINDTYGHVVGDLTLTKLSRILIRIADKAGNIISRFGGEEFMILLIECDRNKLREVAENIRKSIESSPVSFRRKKINFTVSLGAVLYPQDASDSLTLIDKADKLLYQAKREGKNKVCFSE